MGVWGGGGVEGGGGGEGGDVHRVKGRRAVAPRGHTGRPGGGGGVVSWAAPVGERGRRNIREGRREMSPGQLGEWAESWAERRRKRGEDVPGGGEAVRVTTAKIERRREAILPLKKYREARPGGVNRRHYDTIVSAKFATCMADLAFLPLARVNSGYVGVILFVEIYSHHLQAGPIRDQKMPTLAAALRDLVATSAISPPRVNLF